MAAENSKPHSRAFVEEEILLRSDEAQHVAQHSGRQLVLSLQKLAVVLGYLSKDNQVREVEAMIDKAIDKAAAEIAAEMARVQKLIDDNAVTVTPRFNRPVTITVALTTPSAVAYYGLIRQLDELMFRVHQLWFGRVWHNQQRRQAGIYWQRRLMALATHINHTEQRAWKAFNKRSRSDEPDNELDVDTSSPPAPDHAFALPTSGYTDAALSGPQPPESEPSAPATTENAAAVSEPHDGKVAAA